MGPSGYLHRALELFPVDARGHVMTSLYARLWARAGKEGHVGELSLRALCGGDTGSRKPVSRALAYMEESQVIRVARAPGRPTFITLNDPTLWRRME